MDTELTELCHGLANVCENLKVEEVAPEACAGMLDLLGRAQRQLEGVRLALIARLAAVERRRKKEDRGPDGVAGKGHPLGEAHSVWETVERTGKQSPESVRQEVRRAIAAEELYPKFGQAIRAGRLSGDYIDVLQSALRQEELRERAREAEDWLLERALSEPVDLFRKTVKTWKFRNAPRSAEKQARQDKRDEVFRVSPENGGYRLSGWLSALNGQVVHRAIDQAIGVPSRNDNRSPGQRGAEALLDLVNLAVTGEQKEAMGSTSGRGTSILSKVGARHQILVHVPLSTLVQTEHEIQTGCGHLHHVGSIAKDSMEAVAVGSQKSSSERRSPREHSPQDHSPVPIIPPCPVTGTGIGGQGRCLDSRTQVTEELERELGRVKGLIKSGTCPDAVEGFEPARLTDGTPLAPSQLARLMCSSVISRVVFSAHGEPLDASRAQRRFSATQEKAIIGRDRTCRYPGCGRGLELSEIHHAHEWNAGGATTTDNAVLLCFHHHQYVHSERIVITHHAGGFIFTSKDGRIIGIRRHESACASDDFEPQEGLFDMTG